MALNQLTKEILGRKEKLNKMLEHNSDIQTEDIIEFSQELDQLIKEYYILTGFYPKEKVEYNQS